MKRERKLLPLILTVTFAFLTALSIVGTFVGDYYQALINSFFDLRSFEKVTNEGGGDTEYFKSQFANAKGERDDEAYLEHITEVSRRTAEDGAVLLWNKGETLPMQEEASVSLFGKSTYATNYCVNGSGFVQVQNMQDLRTAFQDLDFSVNRTLWNKYAALNPTLSANASVNEYGWESVYTSDSNLEEYGDYAIFMIYRQGCEDGDLNAYTSDGKDGNILNLTGAESDILDHLVEYKNNGVFKKIILLLASSHTVQFSEINKYEKDIDACMWVGMGGKMANSAIVNLLSGKVVPNGRLVNTYVNDSFSHPSTANVGNTFYTNAATEYPDLYNTDMNTVHMSKTAYLVYEEGIYVGYKYFETRYEDCVMGLGNASSSTGAKASQDGWTYAEEVKFPFGYGKSYTEFEYSDFSCNKKAFSDEYEIKVTVENIGDAFSGREIVQVYLQKPYTEYDKANGVEKSAIELAGFAKTAELAPGAKETVTITVDEELFKAYDANNAKTYILEKGDYYLAVGYNAHDAMNNILAAKGKTTADGMDANGNADFAEVVTISNDDFVKYSLGETGNPITNQFEDVNLNTYKNAGDNKTTYLSRKDWSGTYPTGALLKLNDAMAADLAYNKPYDEDPTATMPKYEQDNNMSLVMLRGLDYNNEYWDMLLDQTSFEDQALLVTRASGSTQAITSVNCPGTYDLDGPQGLTKFYNTTSYAGGMCYPCEVLMAATFDLELIREVGRCFGEDMLAAGQQVMYGPGVNIHRTPFSGRNGEYYSEDTFISNVMCAEEIGGMMERGVICLVKHFALNDQEINRHCVNVWSNEQAIREIYLQAFHDLVTVQKCTGIMASFNSLGTTWASAHKGLLTNVLRGEWGFTGYVSTDGADCIWMSHVDGLLAGNDIWMRSGDPTSLNRYKDSPTFCQALREATHRIMYAIVNSNAVNGMDSDSKIVPVINWWQYAIVTLNVVFGIATLACLAWWILTWFVLKKDAQVVQIETKGELPEGDDA